MSGPILATKLYIPPPRPNIVPRPRLIERLSEGLCQNRGFGRKLTLISAPAGFGKTTLVSEWIHMVGAHRDAPLQAAWLSLDEGDNDPVRFLAYLIAALQTLKADIGAGVLAAIQSPQPPPIDVLLTTLLNEIAVLPDNVILVLDDYHVIDAKAADTAPSVDGVLTFLIEHLPPQMHLAIATREDPQLPLARLRARGQLIELRAADLRFTPAEAAKFLKEVMGLNLAAEDITALETRTEGWIAGLQMVALALQGIALQGIALQGAISMPGQQDRPGRGGSRTAPTLQEQSDATRFIQAFTGSHHFVLDYLVEEVLHQQPESIQTFLLCTSILDRLCGPLCEAILPNSSGQETAGLLTSGQETLEYLERANLFLVPLDDERHWYRYHHLFASFLRQRLRQRITRPTGDERDIVAELHRRASQWYEDNGLELEAFQHAAAAHDVERAERLMEGKGMPLHFRGAATTVLDWLASLPTAVLDARPLLWLRQATLSLMNGQTTGVEEKLQAAEAALAARALQNTDLATADEKTRDLIGQIAAARATLALTHYQPETMMAQSRRAAEYLHPDNLTFRFTATWTLAVAYLFLGERAAALQAYTEALAISQASGDIFNTILATGGLGLVQELDNQLYPAAETYRRSLQLGGDPPLPNACEAHLGLARIDYEWNNLDAAEQHGQQSLQLARQYDRVMDRFVISEVFLARLKLAQGDVAGAAALLAQTDQSVRQHNFVHRLPEVAAVQVLVLLAQGKLAAAARLAQTHQLPASLARVFLAQGDPAAALAVLVPFRQQMEAKGWQDELLRAMVLLALAHHACGEQDKAMHMLGDALALAEPGGFIRLFVDEGLPMAQLLSEAADRGIAPGYTGRLLAAFPNSAAPPTTPSKMVESLSPRELQVLRLVAQGLSNREISERLFLALSTVKGHIRIIFDKLQVHRRTEAVARARELGLL